MPSVQVNGTRIEYQIYGEGLIHGCGKDDPRLIVLLNLGGSYGKCEFEIRR